MKICWFCIPAYGHTNPTLALVRAMTERGHKVFYFSFENFREKIEETGARFISCDSYSPEAGLGDPSRVGKDLLCSTRLIVSATLALDGMVGKAIREIGPDLIVSDSVAFWGKLAAMKYHIPYVSSTTTFAFNSASAKYMDGGAGEFLKMLLSLPRVNRELKRLRETGYPVKSILDIIRNDNDTPTVVYTSSYFQPCAETFSEKYCFIGPSLRPAGEVMEKRAEKTVYVSLGTVVCNDALLTACVEALGNTEYQVILSLGGGERPFHGDLPENIQVYDFVDQMAALKIADVFLTHCGMNSASEGLYFGVPLILCPQTQEQTAVARRTEELGAGVRLESAGREEILAAVRRVLSEPAYKSAAEKIADSFRNSGGAERAGAFLESLV